MKILFIALALFINYSLHAFKLTPMTHSIQGGAKKSNVASFTVSNDSDSPIAVQLEIRTREMNTDGKENMEETDDFLIFPDQLILQPQSRRAVKVRWLKGEVKDFERSYRLIAEQLPIEVEKEKKGRTDIKILLRYIASLYVTPKKTNSKIEVLSHDYIKGKNVIKVNIKNLGNIHTILDKPKLVFTQSKKIYTLKQPKELLGENILTDSIRSFEVKAPANLNPLKSFKVTITND